MCHYELSVCEELLNYLNEERSSPRNGGYQYWFSFPNGYAASVIKGPYTYGGELDLWELAVMDDSTQDLCYDTPITDDVLGYLSDSSVESYLWQIFGLPAK